jgi:hypothetical protein
MEESKISRNEMMCNACCLVQYVDLAVENVFGLFVCVWRDISCGSCLNPIESRGQVGWGVGGLSSDALEESDGLMIDLPRR